MRKETNPIALIEGVAILALAGYGFYQRSLAQMWQEQDAAALDAKLELMHERDRAYIDLDLAKDEITALEADRDALKKAMQQMHGRYEIEALQARTQNALKGDI